MGDSARHRTLHALLGVRGGHPQPCCTNWWCPCLGKAAIFQSSRASLAPSANGDGILSKPSSVKKSNWNSSTTTSIKVPHSKRFLPGCSWLGGILYYESEKRGFVCRCYPSPEQTGKGRLGPAAAPRTRSRAPGAAEDPPAASRNEPFGLHSADENNLLPGKPRANGAARGC